MDIYRLIIIMRRDMTQWIAANGHKHLWYYTSEKDITPLLIYDSEGIADIC
jgi:hypothetical protein